MNIDICKMTRGDKDDISLEEFQALSEAEVMLRYLQFRTVWLRVDFAAAGRLMLLIRDEKIVPRVLDALAEAVAGKQEQIAPLVDLWTHLFALLEECSKADDKRDDVLEESMYGPEWKEIQAHCTQLRQEGKDKEAWAYRKKKEQHFWEWDEAGKQADLVPGHVATEWQRDMLERVGNANAEYAAAAKRVAPAYKKFKAAVEAWFCQTQPAEAVQEFIVAERISRETRLLNQLLDSGDYDNDGEDEEMEALYEANSYAWADTKEVLGLAVEFAEADGPRNVPLNLPADATHIATETENALRFAYDEWEYIKEIFWQAVDASDPSTSEARDAFGLVSDIADKAVFVFRQEAHRLQAQGISEATAEEQARDLPEVRQLAAAAVSLNNRFFAEMLRWFEMNHPAAAQSLRDGVAKRRADRRLHAEDKMSVIQEQAAPHAQRLREAKKKVDNAPSRAVEFPIGTSQEIDALFRSAADGHTGRHWKTDTRTLARIYKAPNTVHTVRAELTEEEIADGIGVEALERLTLGQDADCTFAILYVSRLLAPPSPLPHNTAPVAWIDLDDVAQKIGWSPRSTAEREQNRARIWGYLNYGARVVVSGKRNTVYKDRQTGAIIPTEVEGPIWAFHERETPIQRVLMASFEVPLRVEISMTRTWTRLLTDPQTAQYLPLGELLGSIPGGQPSGAWARCIGLALANLWRREPEAAVNSSYLPTRRELLLHYTPKKAVPEVILKSNDPARARDYWRTALRELVKLGFLADEGEASLKSQTAKIVPHKNWSEAWLRERVALRPGSRMLPAVEARVQARPSRLPIS